jgi:DNA-binding GntR family transcriptional regulator
MNSLNTPPPSFDANAEPATGAEAELSPPRTLVERAYRALRHDVVCGRLAPGERLRVEHLKDRYQVGAGTLREALSLLLSDALVTVEGQRGFRVAPMTLEDLEDLTRLRLHIEIDALRQSIRQGTPAWRAGLQHVYDELSALEQPILPENRQRWEALNMQFHEALIAGCGSRWTLNLLRLLARHGERYRHYAMGLSGATRDVHAEHREIFAQAMSGQEVRAALALEAHIRNTLDILQQARQRGIKVFEAA